MRGLAAQQNCETLGRTSEEGDAVTLESDEPKNCVFCEIVAGRAPASVIHEDEKCLGFMTLRPTRPGECLVIPKAHIDHFIDIPATLLAHVTEVTRVVGRALQAEFQPLRVGMVVHGFGVAHAHFILVPQHDPYDITSGRFAAVENGQVVFRHLAIPEAPRSELDTLAGRIRARVDGGERGAT